MYRVITDADNKVIRPQNPRKNANIFEIISFSWLLNLFKIGQKRDLEEDDLYTTLNDHSSSLLGNELEKKWRSELANAQKKNRNPSLLRVLIEIFGYKFMFYGFILFVDRVILKVSQTLFIGGIISYFNPNGSDKADLEYALICAFGLSFSMFTSTILYHASQIEILHCGMKIRVACCSIIYRKSLRLSHTAIGNTTVGQVINLLSNDVSRFDKSATFLHYLWICPLHIIVVTYLLWQEIGVSSLLPIVVLCFLIWFQAMLGRKLREQRKKTAKRTDERIRLMNEIISGIKVIKMYTWEIPFGKLIKYLRKMEIRHIQIGIYIRNIMLQLALIQSRFQLFFSILSYVLLGNYISAQKVFIMYTLYNISILPIHCFYQSISEVIELQVSIKRIQDFLLQEEKDNQLPNKSKSGESINNTLNNLTEHIADDDGVLRHNTELPNTHSIVFSKATAKWTDIQTSNTLENINLSVASGRLIGIIGPVGAGKSSLFQAILRELPLSEGSLDVHGVISYASQEPWVFSGSIKQNIIFNSPIDEYRYKRVINVCALKNDFKKFPYGDETTVGERGVTLSGGQKSRINLARAIYKQANIYLLDDPLSAVDPHVSSHLFEKCIKGFLNEKTCILITHQLQYLTKVDQIVHIDNAKIIAESTYEELQTTDLSFLKSPQSQVTPDNQSICINNNSDYSVGKKTKFDRKISATSDVSLLCDSKENTNQEEQVKIVEIRSSGNISWDTYSAYFLDEGKISKILCLIFTSILSQTVASCGDLWITYWAKLEESVFYNENSSTPTTKNSINTIFQWPISRETCIYVFSAITVCIIIATNLYIFTFVLVCVKASMNLHNNMFSALIGAKINFFNTNLSGSILNRFSKDLGAIDDMLPQTMNDCLRLVLHCMAVLIIVVYINIHLILPTIVLAFTFYKITIFYLSMSRSVKRLEGITRSPVFTHLNASIQGLTTIRAFKAEKILSNEFDVHQDLHSSAWYLFLTSSRAFGLWLDIICFIYSCIVTFSFLTLSNSTFGGNVGLAITQVYGLAGVLQWTMRQMAELENHMTSVERVLEYTNIPQEGSIEPCSDKKPPLNWPSDGQVTFINFYLRYEPNSPCIINHLNLNIESMQKIGIVGRTGAGKSSLVGSLFRLAFHEGNIIIDGIEIHELDLYELRSKLTIIPQQPVLFSGTVRKNLDPSEECPDHILWNALDEVELKDVVENLPDGLNSKMSEDGSNFSVGQRQLVCLARAIVRNTKILVLDEATANVDQQTDLLIQRTIRNKFRATTVLTIAHRLNTVIDSDKVLVLDTGTMVECDHPHNLLQNKEGAFYKMVEQTGHDTADLLHRLAAESYKTTSLNVVKNADQIAKKNS
ncbi:ATP-binding cassette sub-family C member 4-like isoform X2 [Metopolophium dirhodum]|uniref:ATP-binding cassette sub-family C member 4-like isoform X2 n=1 Tax=Metopolophium dirhodum TaxID=44670 RepID=UPI00298F5E03|nr:ATP-binding cassette sub-family C member 4-like isoform X2 [Metopolophium dirhodum]